MLNSSFFGVNVINASVTARSDETGVTSGRHLTKIDKQAFLERIRLQFKDLGFNGLRFVTRSIRLFRLDLSDMHSPRELVGHFDHVKIPDTALHGIPIRLVASSKLTTEFGSQAQIMNLSKAFEKLDIAVTNDLAAQGRRLNRTLENVYNATEVAATVAAQNRRLNRIVEGMKNATEVAAELAAELATERHCLNRIVNDMKNSTRVASELAAQNRRLNTTVEAMKDIAGVVFTRWGRTVCPAGSESIYTGYVVSGDRKLFGGMGMYMCLTDSPRYHTDGRATDPGPDIFRTEFGSNKGFLTTHAGVADLAGHGMLCTICRRSGKSTNVIVWGSTVCKADWYKEYEGTILSGYRGSNIASIGGSKLSTNAICMDGEPEVAPGGRSAVDKSRAGGFEVVCGTDMPCPPFADSESVTCAVCSR